MQYTMTYLESVGTLKEGQRVMQVGMGGGMKVREGGHAAMHSCI